MSAFVPVVWASRGRLFVEVSFEWFRRVAPGGWGGGWFLCVVIGEISGCVVGEEYLGSLGQVIVIGMGWSS
mgnify:CR=1 FL=1